MTAEGQLVSGGSDQMVGASWHSATYRNVAPSLAAVILSVSPYRHHPCHKHVTVAVAVLHCSAQL